MNRRPYPSISSKMTIERGDEWDVTIKGNYVRGDNGCRTLPNGDPGYPPTPSEIIDIEAWFDGDLVKLSDDELERAQEILLQEYEESQTDRYC